MKERPILFSAEMVRAILDGRKSQTRRVVKPQPEPWGPDCWQWHTRQRRVDRGGFGIAGGTLDEFGRWVARHNPFGQPGDRLYVRESFSYWHEHGMSDVGRSIWYWADGNPEDGDWTRPKPSIHMPRWASRITLEITGVRVERVQDIREDDANAEGIKWKRCGSGNGCTCEHDIVGDFAELWDSLNEKRGYGWNENPWVWAIEFRRVDEQRAAP